MHIELLELSERLQSEILHIFDSLIKVVGDWSVSVKMKKLLVEHLYKNNIFKIFLYKIIMYKN